MSARTFFLDDAGHFRRGWRLAFFIVAFLIAVKLLQAIGFLAGAIIFKKSVVELMTGTSGFVMSALILLAAATLAGWACALLFEELPFRALGWSLHSGWL